MKDLHALMRERRSIRSFSNEPISKEVINKIVTAAYFAPTAAKQQGYQIVVVDDPKQKERIRILCEQGERDWVFNRPESIKKSILGLPGFSFQKKFLTDASVLLVISTDPNNQNIPYAIESCWLAIAYILLEIENQGLGSLTYTPSICFTDQKMELNQIIQLPNEEFIQTVLPIGYYSTKPEIVTDSYEKKVHHNRYGNYYSNK